MEIDSHKLILIIGLVMVLMPGSLTIDAPQFSQTCADSTHELPQHSTSLLQTKQASKVASDFYKPDRRKTKLEICYSEVLFAVEFSQRTTNPAERITQEQVKDMLKGCRQSKNSSTSAEGSISESAGHRRLIEHGSNQPDDLLADSEITCTEGYVWIVVTAAYAAPPGPGMLPTKVEPPGPHFKRNMPEGICLQHLKRSGEGSFWEGRRHTILEYLQRYPKVTFVISSDNDVYVNPLTLDDIKSRYQKLVTPTARIVLAVEQSCWFGHICDDVEANTWLSSVRAKGPGLEQLNLFPHSQYMGEADAVKAMLKRSISGVAPEEFDDQARFAEMINETPDQFALDIGETLFLSLARGLVRGGVGMTCNFGGTNSVPCGIPQDPWGECSLSEGLITIKQRVQGTDMQSQAGEFKPLLLHMNGPALYALESGRGCTDVIKSASDGTLM